LLLIGWRSLLLILRLARLRISWLLGLLVWGLRLLVGWGLSLDGCLGEGGCVQSREKYGAKNIFVEFFHGLFLR
jgi:hypothetical protein